MPKKPKPSRFRLSPHVRPSRYRLHLEPDLGAGTFRGSVRTELTLARPAPEITLHAAELSIDSASVTTEAGQWHARVRPTPRDETVTLKFPKRLAPGHATLVLDFSGRLGTHLRGFYAAKADGRPYAFTQLEAADARRMFPCFDEPSFKARAAISVTVGAGETAISNGALEREEALADGRRVLRFRETPPLSTYLLAVAVGVLEASAERRSGSTPIRVWHVPGKGHLTDFALEAAAESLRRLEDYFGIPYPYGKLDLIAVPDFEAGAMENAGAVTFRETLLLVDPATASLAEKKRSAEVIAHELAHMWYGDLVTMAWWDDLWLNEAFATWMAYKVIDDWRPEWRMWQGYEHDRAGALALDALANTHPIYARVRSVAEATENFDAITYEKGAGVVRMIEHYLGAEVFRDGVRLYMQRHREANATARDLWQALEEASGREVTRVAQAWIEKPGFPLVEIRRLPGRGTKLRVRQSRFFADPRVSPAKRRAVWPVPLVLKLGDGDSATAERLLVDGASRTLALPVRKRPPWIFGNANAGGFYRVAHDPLDHRALVERLRSALLPVERLALAGDQWALARAARAGIESFLDIADALREEDDYDVLDGLAAPLAVIDDQVVAPESAVQRAYRAWIAARFLPSFERLGWTPAPGEADDVRLCRAALLRLVGSIAEAPAVVAEARPRLSAYLADRSAVDSNLADAVVSLAAREGDATLYDRYRELAATGQTPQERRRFLLALASFRGAELFRRTLEATLGAEVPTQDVAFLFMRLFTNPAAREAAWRFFTQHWKELRGRIPPLMMSRLVDSAPALREPRYARELAAFFRKHPVPEASRAVKQALEVFRLNAELRRRTAPTLQRWLEGASVVRRHTSIGRALEDV